MKRGMLVFKEGRAARYNLPSFQKTLTGEVLRDTLKIISIIPYRCEAKIVRNVEKSDLASYEVF
jgi:hypothetical protein